MLNESDSISADVQALVDRSAITDCLHRYARGMDRHDREMVRSVYHDDAIDVHGSQAFGVENFIDWAFAYHAEQLHHQHYLTNITIELDGDTAHSETYYLFVGRYPDRETPLTLAGVMWIDSSAGHGNGQSRKGCARPNGGRRLRRSSPTAARPRWYRRSS